MNKPWRHQQTERYGDVALSIVAGVGMYSAPREYLPNLGDYTEVEIAIIPDNNDTRWWRGSDIGLPELDSIFEDMNICVAPYVAWSVVDRIRERLRAREQEMRQAPAAQAK